MVRKFNKSSMNFTNVVLMVSLVILTITVVMYYFPKRMESFTDQMKWKVVYVYSDTCPHCISFTPIFDQFKATEVLNTKLQIIKVEKREAVEYLNEVSGFPTVMIYNSEGKVVDKLVGRTTFTELKNFVQKNTA
jgi:thiol-disulfide isomerase/thioredoxin